MVVFLGLIIYNHNSKAKSKAMSEDQLRIQKEIITKHIENGQLSIDQLHNISMRGSVGAPSLDGTIDKRVTFR